LIHWSNQNVKGSLNFFNC